MVYFNKFSSLQIYTKLMELILLGFRIVLLYGNGTDIYLFGTTLHLESILVRFGLHLVSHKE